MGPVGVTGGCEERLEAGVRTPERLVRWLP